MEPGGSSLSRGDGHRLTRQSGLSGDGLLRFGSCRGWSGGPPGSAKTRTREFAPLRNDGGQDGFGGERSGGIGPVSCRKNRNRTLAAKRSATLPGNHDSIPACELVFNRLSSLA